MTEYDFEVEFWKDGRRVKRTTSDTWANVLKLLSKTVITKFDGIGIDRIPRKTKK